MQGMVNNMEEAKLKTLVQIKAFVDGTSEAVFRVPKEGRNQLSSECSRGLATPLTDGCPSFLDGCARGLKQEDLSAVVPQSNLSAILVQGNEKSAQPWQVNWASSSA